MGLLESLTDFAQKWCSFYSLTLSGVPKEGEASTPKQLMELPNELLGKIVDEVLVPALDILKRFRKSQICAILKRRYFFKATFLDVFDPGGPVLDASTTRLLDTYHVWSVIAESPLCKTWRDTAEEVKVDIAATLDALRTVENLLSINKHLAVITCSRGKLDREETLYACRQARDALEWPVEQYKRFIKENADERIRLWKEETKPRWSRPGDLGRRPRRAGIPMAVLESEVFGSRRQILEPTLREVHLRRK